MDLNGKVAVVTGGAGGIGKAYAEKLLGRGAKVCICDLNENECKKVGAELQSKFGSGNVLPLRCDVTSDDSMQDVFGKVVEKYGGVDIMVNNAGIANDNMKNIKLIFDTNLFSVIRGTEMAMKVMRKPHGHGGIVINTASIQGLIETPAMPLYSTTKAAVIQYSRNMGNDLHYSNTGVRVLALCPSKIDTEMVAMITTSAYQPYNQICHDELKANMPSMAGIKAEVVADALLRLIDEGRTGAVMLVGAEEVDGRYIEIQGISNSLGVK